MTEQRTQQRSLDWFMLMIKPGWKFLCNGCDRDGETKGPYLHTGNGVVLTLSWMAFFMASSSSFCRLTATILASCSLRRRARSIISSSVISEDDRRSNSPVFDSCVWLMVNIQEQLLTSNTLSLPLSHRWAWICWLSPVYVFLSMAKATDGTTTADPEAKSRNDLSVWAE